MKIQIVSKIFQKNDGKYFFLLAQGGFGRARDYPMPESYNPNQNEPQELDPHLGLWAYRNHVICVGRGIPSDEDLLLRVKHAVLREEKSITRIRKEIEAFENMDKATSARRERIPESVRLFVWQRDEGKCVKCGSRELLEFDHIIPLALGGSNTERNIQLLCERCNREKRENLV